MGADWDTLVILDGCRVDTFREVVDNSIGSVEARTSPASESWWFMQEQFVDRDLSGTVYVTANPHVHKLPDGIFHAVIDATDSCWDKTAGVVPPSDMTEMAHQAHENYPQKRIVAHYMQPHYPFLGEHGSFGNVQVDGSDGGYHPWQEQAWGDPIGKDRLKRAYRENLKLTIPHVEDLIHEVSGRVIITSDHANLIGDWSFPIPLRVYGHPEAFPHPKLVTVPWVVAKDGNRREISNGMTDVETAESDQDEVDERLRALGYR